MSGSSGTGSSGAATASITLIVLGLVAAAVDIFFRPFIFTPVAAILVLIGIGISDKYRRFGVGAAVVVSTCFIIGATVAVWSSRALY